MLFFKLVFSTPFLKSLFENLIKCIIQNVLHINEISRNSFSKSNLDDFIAIYFPKNGAPIPGFFI